MHKQLHSKMPAMRQHASAAIFLVFFFGLSFAEQNLAEVQERNSTCMKTLLRNYQALPIQLNANENCIWEIKGERDMNETIRLIFSYVEFSPLSSCDEEYIEVYDGPSTNSSVLGKICRTQDSVFHSSSSTLTFRISTDSTNFTRKIHAFYYYISPETPVCGGYFTSPEGTFTSPNYPKKHPPFTYCVWHIETEPYTKINLIFKEIFIEIDEKCRYDFIAIYDGPRSDSPLIKKVCGRLTPTFTSSSNAMTIVMSADYANSYRGFSARYTTIPISQPNTSLSCSSDNMIITLSKFYLASLNYNASFLHLNDQTCKPISYNPVIFSFPINSCGTIKKTEGQSISYSNVVTAYPTGIVVTRQKKVEIVVKCIMENNSTVEVVYVTESEHLDNTTTAGRYNLSMSFYETDSFSKPVFETPYFVDLNQMLYAQISLHSSDPNLAVFVDTCTASPDLNSKSPKYDLVKSGCTKDDTFMAYPILEHFGRFRFRSFRFLKHYPSVYLHCEVLICDSKDSNSRCTKGCISRQKREISSYKWKGDAVIGPLKLKREGNSMDRSDISSEVHPEESVNAQPQILYILAFVVLATNTVLLVGLAAKRLITRESGYRYQKLSY
ncbi:CUB and zona pellucida-like domain-containing protein 1 [Crotalus tigris]|uniref:CUB and zona pellucida-like domain-containing protein 1 n=1 Tax=Crotalus tigris TaxID=88082 RepID=UPI00192F5660|nr:CUB and zona pellucida-like domain-containing protein 1 [Crotalus tigris]